MTVGIRSTEKFMKNGPKYYQQKQLKTLIITSIQILKYKSVTIAIT